eukprot:TRINITY_DN2251_c0_g1_i1.p1 TRINITY_DN2251_c0_g1~~TRINITY_DN2251_c0_g1_i1.p1  ORF type:complete len:256 (+),score=16.47 TRINITY_DN2251_c0_g1_i1:74-841(+)
MSLLRRVVFQACASRRIQKRTFSEEFDDQPLSQKAYVESPSGPHRGTLVWLHGLGDKNASFPKIFNLLRIKGVRLVVPQAPHIPITLQDEQNLASWFDVLQSLDASSQPHLTQEDRTGIIMSAKAVHDLLDEETHLIDSSRILLGGMAEGAAMAIHAGFRYKKKLAGVISYCGYVPLVGEYPKFLKASNKGTPLLAVHGYDDAHIPIEYARTSYQIFAQNGTLDFFQDNQAEHQMSDVGLAKMRHFIETCLKPVP